MIQCCHPIYKTESKLCYLSDEPIFKSEAHCSSCTFYDAPEPIDSIEKQCTHKNHMEKFCPLRPECTIYHLIPHDCGGCKWLGEPEPIDSIEKQCTYPLRGSIGTLCPVQVRPFFKITSKCNNCEWLKPKSSFDDLKRKIKKLLVHFLVGILEDEDIAYDTLDSYEQELFGKCVDKDTDEYELYMKLVNELKIEIKQQLEK